MGNSVFPRPPYPLRLPLSRVLLLGKSIASDSRPHTACHLDIPQFPTLGRSQYFQLCLVDMLPDPSHRGVYGNPGGSANRGCCEGLAFWNFLVVFQYSASVSLSTISHVH